MAIDRTAYNALVDDDGSNTVGTIIVKNTIKTVLLDPIDAALAVNAAAIATNGGLITAEASARIAADAAEVTARNAAIVAAGVTDATLPTSDITTNNVSITKHGFVPKAPNDATKYLDGTGVFSVPAGGGGGTVVQTTTLTGTQNDVVLTAGCTELRCNNATLLTLTGLAAGSAGQRLTILSVGAGQVDLANQAGGSLAANRLINGAALTANLAAGKGVATLEYDATATRWRLTNHAQGAWITRPFSAANFAGQGTMTWTVASAAADAYLLNTLTRTLIYSCDVAGTIGGTPTPMVLITLPNGAVANLGLQLFPAVTQQAGNAGAYCYTAAAGTVLNCAREITGNTNWSAGSGTVFATVTVEVQ